MWFLEAEDEAVKTLVGDVLTNEAVLHNCAPPTCCGSVKQTKHHLSTEICAFSFFLLFSSRNCGDNRTVPFFVMVVEHFKLNFRACFIHFANCFCRAAWQRTQTL